MINFCKKLLLFFFFCPLTMMAQNSNGTRIIGKIVDETNNGIEGVNIMLHNKPINARTSEGSQGAFMMPTLNMPIGNHFFLKVEKKGYFLANAFEGNLFKVTPETRKEGYAIIKMRKVPQLTDKPRIALLPFCNFGDPSSQLLVRAFVAPIRKGLIEIDTAKLQVIPYSLVELAMKQYNLTAQDYCDQVKILAVGNALNANIVITGAYQFLQDRINIDCEFTDVYQKTDFKDPIFISKPEEELPKIQDELANEIVKRFGIKTSAKETELISSWTSESTSNTDAYLDYANGLQALDEKQPQEAEKQFQKSLIKDSNNARAWQEQANAQIQQNKNQEAQTSLEKAEKIAQNKPDDTKISLWEKIATLFDKAAKPKKAAELFQKIKVIDPYFVVPSIAKDTMSLIPNLDLETVLVKGGKFMMGCDDSRDGNCNVNERPLHEVELSDFRIGKTEVTNAQYAKFLNTYGTDKVKAGEYKGQEMIQEHNWGLKKVGATWQAQTGYENHPVIFVSWYGASEFCKFYGGSLPTEAQWEYAARGGQKSQKFKYAGSNNLEDVAWNEANSYNKGSSQKDYGTHAVAQKKPNELDIYDLSGNVWEWCEDFYDAKFYGKSVGIKNPVNKNNSGLCVDRGGSWRFNSEHCRAAYRYLSSPTYRDNFLGFRLVLSL